MTDSENSAAPIAPALSLPADAPWWARWLVDNAAEWWRWWSTWFTTAAAAAPLVYDNVSQIQAVVSPTCFHWIESVLVILIFVGRMKRQTPKEQP